MFFSMERDSKGLFTVLNSERTGERDRLLTLISPSEGLLRARVYGAQKSARSIKVPLFSDGVFSLYHASRNKISVKDVEIINLRDGILSDIDKTTSAVLFSELVMNARSSDESLYRLLTRALDALEVDLPYKRVVIMFVIRFLSLGGTFGDYEHCPVCQRVYSDDEILGYNNQIGASCCQNCSTGDGGLILPPNARAFIRESIKAGDDEVFSFRISDAQEDRIFRFLLRLLRASSIVEIRTLSSGLWNF